MLTKTAAAALSARVRSRAPTPDCSRVAARLFGVLAAGTLALLGALAPSSPAAAPLGWSGPRMFDEGGAPTGVSCASEGLCVAVDSRRQRVRQLEPGIAVGEMEPAADRRRTRPQLGLVHALRACAWRATAPGRVFVSANPLAGASSWGSPAAIAKSAITGVSCASASLCAATDTGGEVLVSTNPTAGAAAVAAHPARSPRVAVGDLVRRSSVRGGQQRPATWP